MKNSTVLTSMLVVTLLTLLTGCQAIADIFKAGMWTGIIIVVFIIVLIVGLITRGKKK